MSSTPRRLTLSPIGFDLILALSQTPDGLRLAELAHVIGSPVSSVQTALRVLTANGLVRRESLEPPRYRLTDDHPAAAPLMSTATVIADAAHSIGVILRANPAVLYAAVDASGFLVGEDDAADRPVREALDRQLGLVASARPDGPPVVRISMDELDRLVRVQLELRARARGALTIKGRPPLAARAPVDDRGRRAAG